MIIEQTQISKGEQTKKTIQDNKQLSYSLTLFK